MKRKALLVIDMLNDFIDSSGVLFVGNTGEKLVETISGKLDEFRRHKNPIIYVCDNHRADDPEFDMFPPHCVEGTWGAKIVAGLKPEEKDFVVKKRRYSAFFGTDLDLTLREEGIEEIVLTGVCTNICVLYTACDARMRNYRVVVPADAVTSFSETGHSFALEEMKNVLGVDVV